VRSEESGGVELDVRGEIWTRVGALADRQRGMVARWQLLGLGLTRRQIDGLIKRRLLHPMHRGVYLVGHRVLAPLAREQAALLVYGENACISHTSAASIWTQGAVPAPTAVDVTVVGRTPRPRPGIRLHLTAALGPADLRNIDGLPFTAPARTAIDLAAAGAPGLEALYSEMLARRLVRDGDVVAALERAGRRRGVKEVRALIKMHRSGFTRSEAERLMRKLCREAQLPQPLTNVRVEGVVADFFWRAANLIVEVDGFQFHGHRMAFERDRRRDARLVAAGFRVIRVTWRQLTETPLAVIATLAGALGAGARHARTQH
jgi:very-short-patch-repair endonuclease